jgi:hypothetical protein
MDRALKELLKTENKDGERTTISMVISIKAIGKTIINQERAR